MYSGSFDTHLDDSQWGEVEINVEYNYTPGSPGTYDDPPEDAEIDITEIWISDTKDNRTNGIRGGFSILEKFPSDEWESLMEEAYQDATADRSPY